MAAGFGLLRLSPDAFWDMTPKEMNAALAQQLQARAKQQPDEVMVLLGANAATGFVDLTARELGKAKATKLPAERVLVSPALLEAYATPRIEQPALPAGEPPAQVLQLQ